MSIDINLFSFWLNQERGIQIPYTFVVPMNTVRQQKHKLWRKGLPPKNFAINITSSTRRPTNGLISGEHPGSMLSSFYSFVPLDSIILGGLLHCFIPSRVILSKPCAHSFSHLLSFRICQEIYLNLGKNGFLEKQEKEQTYCTGCSK